MNPSTYTVYRQWWKDRYGYDCPITEAAFERYLHLDRPRERIDDTQFDLDTERREGWANGQ
jgi:hypothetical protein